VEELEDEVLVVVVAALLSPGIDEADELDELAPVRRPNQLAQACKL